MPPLFALSLAEKIPEGLFHLFGIPASRGFLPASAHLCVYSHMAVVTQGTQVGGVVHETVFLSIVDAVLHGLPVMHLSCRGDVAL